MVTKHRRKKTAHTIEEVFRVLKSHTRGTLVVQRALREPYAISGIPEGFFCVVNGRVICPKKRGEKVLVTYSSVFEEEI